MDRAVSEAPLTSAQNTLCCRNCGRALQHTFIDLGMSPLCENFLTEEQLGEPETFYPLHVRFIAAKKEGKRICGYGAPGKGNTLLNYCGIGTDFLDFTVDRNPYKHGRYTPGMHVPIEPVEAIDAARPDYILILPWNLKEEIVEQMRHVGNWGAKFIVPIPEIEVLDPGGSQSGHKH